MKKIKISVLVLLAGFSLSVISCQQKKEKQNTVSNIESEVHEHSQEKIELNQGEKWKVEPKMMLIIRKIENEITGFKGNELTDYQSLASNIDDGLNDLTSSCTMQGKAHDELHKWLVPFMEMVAEFSESKSTAESNEYVSKLKSEFNRFNTYFI
ncbi:MAG: hypothetical protein ACK5B9_09025 [Flavobacteriia bacterium]|jgi:hypothetical protein